MNILTLIDGRKKPQTGAKTWAINRGLAFRFWKSTVHRTMNEQVAEIMCEERVAENARNDGRHNIPRPDATESAVTEQRITERTAINLKAIIEGSRQELREKAVTISGLSVTAVLMRLKEMPSAAAFDISKALADSRDEMVRAKSEERLRERDLRHFQRAHELHRSPSYPSAAVKPWLWFLLGLVTLIESGLNANFWGPVNEYGLIGGFFKAAFISVLNIVPAVLTGIYIVPKLAHKHTGKRAYAWALFIGWSAWAGLYNIFVGHWRLAAEAGTGAVSMRTAVTSMLAHPIHGLLGSGDAVMLVVAGAIAALIAVVDAFAMDDSYYGYGAIGRCHEKAQRVFDNLKKGLRAELGEIVSRYGHEASNAVSDTPNHVRQINSLSNEAARIREEANNSAAVHQSVLESALKSYRDENRRVRTAPAPAHFSTYPVLDRPDFDVSFDAIIADRQRFMEEVGQINPIAERVKNDLLHLAEEQFDTLVQFVESIEVESQRKLRESPPVALLQYNRSEQ